jgi:Co/Zn/Cd efflux system component
MLEDLIRSSISSTIEAIGKTCVKKTVSTLSQMLLVANLGLCSNQMHPMITSPEEAKKLSKLIKTSQLFTISKEDALETIINDRLSKNPYYSLVKKNNILSYLLFVFIVWVFI